MMCRSSFSAAVRTVREWVRLTQIGAGQHLEALMNKDPTLLKGMSNVWVARSFFIRILVAHHLLLQFDLCPMSGERLSYVCRDEARSCKHDSLITTVSASLVGLRAKVLTKYGQLCSLQSTH